MRGYLTEYETPYTTDEGKVFIPEACYVTFLECLDRHKGKVVSSIFEEKSVGRDVIVLGDDTFGWEAILRDKVNQKEVERVFIPDKHLNEASLRFMERGIAVELNDWTNRIMFNLELPVITE